MSDTPKNVQISLESFLRLAQYFYMENHSENLYKAIQADIEHKIDALMRHQYYTDYKTGNTEQAREQARQKYLNSVGITESFRWSAEYEQNRKNC